MVGIRGISKGCGTCYQRRIKCDETRPTCLRCRASKRHCTGYRGMTFVSFAVSEAGLQRLQVGHAESTSPNEQSVSFAASSEALLDLHHLSPWADDMCIAYARAHLPNNWNSIPQWHKKTPYNSKTDLLVGDNLVHCALLALSRTLFANRFQQYSLLNEGFALYRQVLLAVNHALSRSDRLERLDLLKAILVLRGFDAFIYHSPGAWIQHSLGVERLLGLRGPDAHRSLPARTLLEEARPLIIMACLKIRKPTILGSEEWKTIPWSTEAGCKPILPRLMDIFADLPAIVHARTVQTTLLGEKSQERPFETKAQGVQFLQDLKEWRLEWEREFPTAWYDVKASFPSHIGISSLWSTALEFSIHQYAETLLFYDSICILALTMIFDEEISTLHRSMANCCTANEELHSSFMSYKSSAPIEEESPHSNLLGFYHIVLFEACRCIPYVFAENYPVGLLIRLRQIWMATRRLNCPMAKWLDVAMLKIAESAREGVRLVIDA